MTRAPTTVLPKDFIEPILVRGHGVLGLGPKSRQVRLELLVWVAIPESHKFWPILLKPAVKDQHIVTASLVVCPLNPPETTQLVTTFDANHERLLDFRFLLISSGLISGRQRFSDWWTEAGPPDGQQISGATEEYST